MSTVVYAVADPESGRRRRSEAAGGRRASRSRSGVLADDVAGGALREWLHKQRTGRPHVTWKFASSVDGRSAAADGSSQWITGEAARADVHRLPRGRRRDRGRHRHRLRRRSDVDGATARRVAGRPAAACAWWSVSGRSRPDAKVLNDDSRTMVIRTRDPHEVIRALSDRTDVLLEGGPTLAGAFLRAGVIDRILAYVAPILLGGPITAVDDVGVLSIVAGAAVALRRRRAPRARRADEPGAAEASRSRNGETCNSFARQCDSRHAWNSSVGALVTRSRPQPPHGDRVGAGGPRKIGVRVEATRPGCPDELDQKDDEQ